MNGTIFKKKNNQKKIETSYIFKMPYVKYLIDKYLVGNGPKSVANIYDFLLLTYDTSLLDKIALKDYLSNNYEYMAAKYSVYPKHVENLVLSDKIADLISSDESAAAYNNLFKNLLADNDHSHAELIIAIFNIHYESNCFPKDYYLSTFYYLVCNYNDIVQQFNYLFKEVDPMFFSIDIKQIIADEQISRFLLINNITTLKELSLLPTENLVYLNILNLEHFLSVLSKLNLNKTLINSTDEKVIYPFMSDIEISVIEQRFNYLDNKKNRTLNDLGVEHNITRERIRQIESRAVDKLKKISSSYDFLIEVLFKYLKNENRNYFSVKVLQDYIKNDKITNIILFHINSKLTPIRFFQDLDCLYNSDYIDEKEIYIEETKNLDNVLILKDDDLKDPLYKKIIEHEYKNYDSNVYIKKGVNSSELYLDIIREHFKSGYKPNENHDELKEKFLEKYKGIDESKFPNAHSLISKFARNDFVLVDRGAYLPIDMCPEIDKELLNKIIFFISQSDKMVYYKTIYEKFKNELTLNHVNNHYMMKGLIDRNLPSNMYSKRDYILIDCKDITAYEIVMNYIKTFDSAFTMDDLNTKFPGIAESVFLSYLMPEIDKLGLINISYKEFIYIDKLNIDNYHLEEIKSIIDNMFNALNSDTISVIKMYAKIKLSNKKLYDDLSLSYGSYYLFSLIRYLFKDEYFYSRPFINKRNVSVTNSWQLIRNYVLTLDSFNINDITNYKNKMSISSVNGYLNFMDDLSDDFVQIKIDAMIKKELLDINEFKIKQIKEVLYMLIKNFGEINTKIFKAYELLPKLKYEWNKYLLTGIIKTYLNEEFCVEYTSNMYKLTDYIIRRSDKNE